MNPRLKKIVFKKLYQDLSKAEIIVAENKSIWFIDRANKYWYFELENSGTLWWRYEFFTDFFTLFCLEVNEFQPLLSEWVEGVLNCGVSSTNGSHLFIYDLVEGVLNCGVSSTMYSSNLAEKWVEGVLNCGVSSTEKDIDVPHKKVEGVLNCKVTKTGTTDNYPFKKVEEVLNCKVITTDSIRIRPEKSVEDVLDHGVVTTEWCKAPITNTVEKVLNHKVVSILPANIQNDFVQQVLVNELIYEVESADPLDTPASDSVDEVLRHKVTKTLAQDVLKGLGVVEDVLDHGVVTTEWCKAPITNTVEKVLNSKVDTTLRKVRNVNYVTEQNTNIKVNSIYYAPDNMSKEVESVLKNQTI